MIFHNSLAGCGPVRVTVVAEPKWLPGKKTFVVELTLHTNPPQEGAYWAENAACGQFFAGKVGQTFTIIARGGGKTEAEKASAQITYVGEAGAAAPPQQQNQPAQQPVPQQQATRHAPGSAKSKDGLRDLKAFMGRNETGIKIALKRAAAVKADFEAEYNTVMDSALFHSVFSGMLYGVTASGIIQHAPSYIEFKTLLPKGAVAGAPAPASPEPPPSPIMCEKCNLSTVPHKGDWCEKCKQEYNDDVPF